MAVSFREQAAYLCEITYAARAPSLLARLTGWDQHWTGIRAAFARDSGVPLDWRVRPWLFVPEGNAEKLKQSIGDLKNFPGPRITCLEEILPWRYRSWNRGAYIDPIS